MTPIVHGKENSKDDTKHSRRIQGYWDDKLQSQVAGPRGISAMGGSLEWIAVLALTACMLVVVVGISINVCFVFTSVGLFVPSGSICCSGTLLLRYCFDVHGER
jgi:hypothetical protein